MANITDPSALKFCDQQARVAADLLCQSYNLADALNQRWIALGSNQTALDQMQLDFRNASDRFLAAYNAAYWTEKVWNSGISALFPNDTSPVFDNGTATAADPNRPALTGAKVTNVVTRCMEVQNWLLSAGGLFTQQPQVETATAVGTITGSGNATVVVTANQMAGSPKTVSVAVLNTDTAATWAGKVRTALAADSTVNAFFSVGGSSATIVLTALTAAVNDPSINVSLANGTCTGITAAPTSANTTAGVAPRNGSAYLLTASKPSSLFIGPTSLSDAQNFVTRCTELKANYEASSSANLTTLLAAAVNPNKS